jgi:prepilin-type processing-associated H-X9-DG protein
MPRTQARFAFTLLELAVVFAIIAALSGLLLPAIHRLRDAAWRAHCSNNLRQIGLALHQYHDNYHALPPAVRRDAEPYLGWSARILPYLEQQALWDRSVAAFAAGARFSRNPPHTGLATVLPVVICPADGTAEAVIQPEQLRVAFTHYLGVSGRNRVSRDGVLYLDSQVPFADIRDGLSNTLLVGERPPSVDEHFGWWYGGIGQVFDGSADSHLGVREINVTFRAPTCPRGPYRFQPAGDDAMCDTFHYWSRHVGGGAHFLFCDGSVRFLAYAADAVLPALATRAGGESVPAGDW